MTTTSTTIAAIAVGSGLAVGVAGAAMAATTAAVPTAVTTAPLPAVMMEPILDPTDAARLKAPERELGPAHLPGGRIVPVKDFYVSAGWGHSSGPHAGREHGGIDMAAPMNEPIRSASDGKVIMAGSAGGYGNAVEIRTESGKTILYGHMNKVTVSKGDKVSAGDRIGAVGSTGYSTGPHLHFEVRNAKDKAINPHGFLGVDKGELVTIAKKLGRKH